MHVAVLPIPLPGLYSWYKSKDLGKGDNVGNNWVSVVGTFTAKPTSGSVKTVKTTGHGATSPLWAVQGDTKAKYTFGKILTDEFTICSLTRYTGGARQRILNGDRSNWLHGHHGGKAGASYHVGWVGGYTSRMKDRDDWVNLCGTTNALVLDGKTVGTRGDNILGNQNVVINQGQFATESSDWMVAEVITWDRKLSETEMKQVTGYLKTIIDGEPKPFRLSLRFLFSNMVSRTLKHVCFNSVHLCLCTLHVSSCCRPSEELRRNQNQKSVRLERQLYHSPNHHRKIIQRVLQHGRVWWWLDACDLDEERQG